MSGSDDRIAEVFQRYRKDIESFLRRRLSSQEDIEDLLQDTFLRAQGHSSWDDVVDARAYLLQMARNLFLNHLRSKSRNIVNFGQEADTDSLESRNPSPEQSAITQDEFQRLCLALEALSPNIRQAVVLRKLNGLSYQEIGRAMQLSPRTVEKHVAKALAHCSCYRIRQGQDQRAGKVAQLEAKRAAQQRLKEEQKR